MKKKTGVKLQKRVKKLFTKPCPKVRIDAVGIVLVPGVIVKGKISFPDSAMLKDLEQ